MAPAFSTLPVSRERTRTASASKPLSASFVNNLAKDGIALVYTDEFDIYGSGVNLAARVAGFDLGLSLLRKGGLFVGVGLPPTSKSIDKAKAAGLQVMSVAEAAKWADVMMIATPDELQAALTPVYAQFEQQFGKANIDKIRNFR